MVASTYAEDCAFNFCEPIISKKWNINLILEFITVQDSLSFSEIADRIPEISPRMLSMRLKFLIKQGILIEIENPEKPKKVRYKMSEMGFDLARVLKLLREWSLKYGDCENETCLNNECKHGLAINQLVDLKTPSN